MNQDEPEEVLVERMRVFLKNRAAIPVEELARFAGEWVAYNPEGTAIVAHSAESVGDVDFDFGGVDRSAGSVGDGEVGGAGACPTVENRDGFGVGDGGLANEC